MRIGDVGVIAGEPLEYPNGRVVSRSMDNRLGCFVAFEVARLVAEAGGAPGDVAGVAVAQEEITFAGARTTAYSLQPDLAIVVDVTFATDAPGIEEKELGKHKFGTGPVITRGSTLDPQVFELLHAAGEESGDPVHGRGVRALHRHRRRRRAHLARRHPDRRRLHPAALHALAGRDGAARRRRERREADRRLRAEAQRGPRLQALSRLLLLWDIDGTLLLRASIEHALALRGAIEGVHGVSLDGLRRVEAAGRTDTAIARDLLRAAGVDDAAIDARGAEVAARHGGRVRGALPARHLRARRPGRARGAGRARRGARRVRAVARHRQSRADRAPQARRGRPGRLLPERPGRLRLRRRGARRAARPRARGAPAAGRASGRS